LAEVNSPVFPTTDQLAGWLRDARQRTLELIADLSDRELLGPSLAIVNPLLWEIGHVAWFQEKWVLRHASGRPALRPDADALYDSSAVAHDTRWDLHLPRREQTLGYMKQVLDDVLEVATNKPHPENIYFLLLSLFHEDMHTEAFTYTRQTLGYAAPRLTGRASPGEDKADQPCSGDVRIEKGKFVLGAKRDEPFVFDNEKWAHAVHVKPYAIARTPVTQADFAAFVEEGGYQRRELWDDAAWQWRQREAAEQPVYWRRDSRDWLRRDFDCWVPLEPQRPVIHVNWFEAQSYCHWAGRRLPTEAEWEAAAAGEGKRRFPWGDEEPTTEHANLDGRSLGCANVSLHSAGDSVHGCRQMIGNVWEWTADAFLPYPGFEPDPYKEYSAPWFGDHKVLRGGCWATRGRLLRNTYRNFYLPQRRDVFAGFRTCALSS
jgi:iron(II)-dependent oxidoreductase